MTERVFDAELNELNELILKMGNMVESSIRNSIEALKNRDESLSKKVISEDEKVDSIELEVDDKCITLLATRQPMAADLRFITTGMRIATDLERMGDLAVDVAQKNLELLGKPLIKPLIDIPKLADLAVKMIHTSLDMFVTHEGNRSNAVHDMENEADRLRNLVTEEIVEIMKKDPKTIDRGLPLILISRFLERICDHAMNIAEDVVYMVEARVIRHQKI